MSMAASVERGSPLQSRVAMATFLTALAGYAPMGLLLRAWRGSIPAGGLVVSSAVARNPLDLLARGSSTIRQLRFMPQLGSSVTDVGRPDHRSDATAETRVILGDVNADVETSSLPFPLGGLHRPALRSHRVRTLDRLFFADAGPEQRVCGLHIAESTARAAEVLRGAGTVLAAHRPALLLALDGSAACAEVAATLSHHRYVALDQHLWCRLPSEIDAEDIALHGEWMLALPAEEALGMLQRGLPGPWSATATGPADAWNPEWLRYVWIACRSGGLWFDGLAGQRSLTVPLDIDTPRWGFYPSEGDPGSSWTWIGPRPSAGLVLPSIGQPLARVRLNGVNAVDTSLLDQVCAVVDGTPAQLSRDISAAAIDIRPAGGRQLVWQPHHEVVISLPKSVCLNSQDQRRLAMSFGSATLFSHRH